MTEFEQAPRVVRIVDNNRDAAPTRVLRSADLQLALKRNALADLVGIQDRLSWLKEPDIDQLLVAPIAALRAEIAKG
jgi:hypothetical protein